MKKRNESKLITMENHRVTKRNNKSRRKKQNIQKTVNKMAGVSSYLSIIILNGNGLNFPIKRYRVAKWGGEKKQDSPIQCLQEIHFTCKDIQTESEGMKN